MASERIGSIELLLKAQTSAFQTQMLGAERRLLSFNSKALLAASGLAAVGTAVVSSVKTFGDFEAALVNAGTKIRATEEELQKLREAALKAGKQTKFTATEAADGLAELGKAGFSASEQVKALPAVLDLATAESVAVSKAADIASTTMRSFGKSASDMRNIADVLSKTTSIANTELEGLGQAMSQVAPIANTMNISFEETSGLLATLAKRGIRGGRAGRMLRNTFLGLQDAFDELGVSSDDVNQKIDSFSDALEVLDDNGLEAANAQDLFTKRTASTIQILLEAQGEAKNFSDALKNDVAGETADKADTKLETLNDKVKVLKGSLQTLASNIGDYLDGPLKEFLDWATEMVNVMNRFDQGDLILLSLFTGGGAAAGSLAGPGGTLAGGATGATAYTELKRRFDFGFKNDPLEPHEYMRDFAALKSFRNMSIDELREIAASQSEFMKRLESPTATGAIGFDESAPSRDAIMARRVLNQRLSKREQGIPQGPTIDRLKGLGLDDDGGDDDSGGREGPSPGTVAAARAKEAVSKGQFMGEGQNKKFKKTAKLAENIAERVRQQGKESHEAGVKLEKSMDRADKAMRKFATRGVQQLATSLKTLGRLTGSKGVGAAGVLAGSGLQGAQTGISMAGMASAAGIGASTPIGWGMGLMAGGTALASGLASLFGGDDERQREQRRRREAQSKQRQRNKELAQEIAEQLGEEMERRQLMTEMVTVNARGVVGGTRNQIARDLRRELENELQRTSSSL